MLVHSPLVGPRTWEPVASALGARGLRAAAPSLLGVAEAPAPYWPWVVERVREAVRPLPADTPLLLVLHSNAGLFAPVLASDLDRPVTAVLFVDAGVPAPEGPTPLAEPEFAAFLSTLAVDGRLPPWTEWWPADRLAPLFPDAATQAAVAAECPSLPLAYFDAAVPARHGWETSHACAYLMFSAAYGREAAAAARRAWPVARLAGGHLHMLVEPTGVAASLLHLVALAYRPGERRRRSGETA